MHSGASLVVFHGYLCAAVRECIQNTSIAGCVCLQASSNQQSRADLQLGKHTFSKCAQPYGDQNFIFLSALPQKTD